MKPERDIARVRKLEVLSDDLSVMRDSEDDAAIIGMLIRLQYDAATLQSAYRHRAIEALRRQGRQFKAF